MRLLDLFCGAGGAAYGYHQAGFDEIVGVDIEPQPDYPFTFVRGDATQPPFDLADFDLIHASPPCQAFTQMSARWRGKGGKADEHPDLLTPTLEMLESQSTPWVVENVVGAKRLMRNPIKLHGGMFDLAVHRPRLFDLSFWVLVPRAKQTESPVGVYGKPDGREVYRYRNNGNMKGKSLIRAWKSLEEGQQALEVPWMTSWHSVREAIPPAYTRYLGEQFIAQQEAA